MKIDTSVLLLALQLGVTLGTAASLINLTISAFARWTMSW